MKAQLSVVLMFALLMVGCVSLPSSPEQQIAAGYVTVETLAEATLIAHQDGHLDTAEKGRIKEHLNLSIKYLHLAEQMTGNNQDATAYLELSSKLLNEIAQELQRSQQ
ncbi:MAG: hypothetical protein ACTHWH_06040 [Marinobacter sp.]